jgi:hypothetical protein
MYKHKEKCMNSLTILIMLPGKDIDIVACMSDYRRGLDW